MVPIDELPDLDTAKQVARLLQAENERLHRRLEQFTTVVL
jgi:transposase